MRKIILMLFVLISLLFSVCSFATQNDSVLNHSIELNAFRSFSNTGYYLKSDQMGYNIKLNYCILKSNNFNYSLNPFFSRINNQYFRGAFFDSTNVSSDIDLVIVSNSFGFSGGIEYVLGPKFSLKTEFGLTYSKIKKIAQTDDFIDTSTFSYCPNPIYQSFNKIENIRIGFYSSVSSLIKLNKHFGFNFGLHYRPSHLRITNTSSFEKCLTKQVNTYNLPLVKFNVSFGANIYF